MCLVVKAVQLDSKLKQKKKQLSGVKKITSKTIKLEEKGNKMEKFNQSQYINEWKRINNKQYAFRFNKESDKDVIEKLDSKEDKTDYIRQLIRKDIKRCK